MRCFLCQILEKQFLTRSKKRPCKYCLTCYLKEKYPVEAFQFISNPQINCPKILAQITIACKCLNKASN